MKVICVSEGVFSLGVPVDSLFFIGSQLVATSHTGKVGVWNAVTQHWQVREFIYKLAYNHNLKKSLVLYFAPHV